MNFNNIMIFTIFSDHLNPWRLVFKATNTVTESVYDTFIGTNVVSDPTEEHLSLDSTCSSGCWYKHPLVENWNNVPISEARWVQMMYM